MVQQKFGVDEKIRTAFIEDKILAFVPEKERPVLRERINTIVLNYVGCDIGALSVLAFAAEKSAVVPYILKLEEHYRTNLAFVHPEARRCVQDVPGAARAEQFFKDCFKELGYTLTDLAEI